MAAATVAMRSSTLLGDAPTSLSLRQRPAATHHRPRNYRRLRSAIVAHQNHPSSQSPHQSSHSLAMSRRELVTGGDILPSTHPPQVKPPQLVRLISHTTDVYRVLYDKKQSHKKKPASVSSLSPL